MPNNINNRVVVSAGDSNQLTEFFEKCFIRNTGELHFDFESILPMPEDLRGICSGCAKINGKSVEVWKVNKDGNKVAIPTKEITRLKRTYGATNGYDWHVQNWGTKWNAYNTSVVYDGTTSIEFEFETAWNPPLPIYEKLTEMFDGLDFSHYSS